VPPYAKRDHPAKVRVSAPPLPGARDANAAHAPEDDRTATLLLPPTGGPLSTAYAHAARKPCRQDQRADCHAKETKAFGAMRRPRRLRGPMQKSGDVRQAPGHRHPLHEQYLFQKGQKNRPQPLAAATVALPLAVRFFAAAEAFSTADGRAAKRREPHRPQDSWQDTCMKSGFAWHSPAAAQRWQSGPASAQARAAPGATAGAGPCAGALAGAGTRAGQEGGAPPGATAGAGPRAGAVAGTGTGAGKEGGAAPHCW